MTINVGGYFRIAFSVLLIVLILVGNTLVILSYRFNSRIRTVMYFLIMSLAVSDALIGAVTLPLWIYAASFKQWRISVFLQVFYLSFDIFTALASTLHLTVISIERFVAISRPFVYNTLRPRVYVVSILTVWTISLILAGIYPLAKLYPNYNGTPYLKIYTLSFIFVFFIAPLVLITVINIAIYVIVRKLTRSQPARHASQEIPTMQIHTRLSLRKEYKTALTLGVVTVLFYASWIPFLVVSLLSLFCLETCLPSPAAQLLLMELIKWFQYSQSAFNPFIYAFRDREIRIAFYRLFLWCGRSARVSPDTILNLSVSGGTRVKNAVVLPVDLPVEVALKTGNTSANPLQNTTPITACEHRSAITTPGEQQTDRQDALKIKDENDNTNDRLGLSGATAGT